MAKRKVKIVHHFTRSKQSDEKIARDMIRIELSSMLKLASAGHGDFGQDILSRASSAQKDWIKREMRKIAQMLDHKIQSEDDA